MSVNGVRPGHSKASRVAAVSALTTLALLASTTAFASRPVGMVKRASCIDRSLSMERADITAATQLYARQIRRTVEAAAAGARVKVRYYTGFFAASGYRDAFAFVPPVTVPLFPSKPANPYDPDAVSEWQAKVDQLRRGLLKRADQIAALRPPQQKNTDLRGCLIRATADLGAKEVLLATDLEPYGPQQSGRLAVDGTKIVLIFFCSLNDARGCHERRDSWAKQLRDAGAIVDLIDPADVPSTQRVF